MAPATAIVMPAEALAVTQPAAAPVAWAIAALARRCTASIETNAGRTVATASTTAGTARDAPRLVMVPAALINGAMANASCMASVHPLGRRPVKGHGPQPTQPAKTGAFGSEQPL